MAQRSTDIASILVNLFSCSDINATANPTLLVIQYKFPCSEGGMPGYLSVNLVKLITSDAFKL